MQREYRLSVASRGPTAESESPGGGSSRIGALARGADLPGQAGGEAAWCRAAIADFAPGRVVWDDSSDLPIPDFDDRPMLSVSGRARGLIEAIEPAIHHFLPVVYCDGDGQVIERRYFLIVGRNPDGCRIGRSHMWHDGCAGHGPCLSPTLADAIRAAGMTGLSWDDPADGAGRGSGAIPGRIR